MYDWGPSRKFLKLHDRYSPYNQISMSASFESWHYIEEGSLLNKPQNQKNIGLTLSCTSKMTQLDAKGLHHPQVNTGVLGFTLILELSKLKKQKFHMTSQTLSQWGTSCTTTTSWNVVSGLWEKSMGGVYVSHCVNKQGGNAMARTLSPSSRARTYPYTTDNGIQRSWPECGTRWLKNIEGKHQWEA